MTDIYGALAAVMADVDHVAKRDRNEHQKFLFRGIDAVVNAVGPVLRKHRVIVVPELESVTYDVVATSTGKPATACRMVVAYRFYAEDGTGITTRVAAEAWDAGDKAAPKAMSVAFRTALLQALALPTDDPEPDAQTYVREHSPQRQQPPREAQRGTGDRPQAGPGPITTAQLGALHGALNAAGLGNDRDAALRFYAETVGREVESSKDLTKREASQVIDALKGLTATDAGTDDAGWAGEGA